MRNHTEFSDNTSICTLQLPSRIESISVVENFIDELSVQYDFKDELYAKVLTCLSEAVNNAIVHGNRESSEKKVYLNPKVIGDKRLIFTITDEGEGFDFNKLLDPSEPENIENLTGRGVFLIQKLADQCVFNSKGNELELHFKI
jgi:serine/threonine-protein kinase RsbW